MGEDERVDLRDDLGELELHEVVSPITRSCVWWLKNKWNRSMP